MRSLEQRWSLYSKHEDDQVKPPIEITEERVPELTFGAYDFDGAHPEYKPLGEFSQDRRFIDERRGIIAVFDGVGSGVASGRMADVAIEALKRSILMELPMDEPISDSDMHGYILSALQDMHDSILQYSYEHRDEILASAKEYVTRVYGETHGEQYDYLVNEAVRSSTTTIALAKTFVGTDGKARVATVGVGDSRIYLRRHDCLFQLSQDDTLSTTFVETGVLSSPRKDDWPQTISVRDVVTALLRLERQEAELEAALRSKKEDPEKPYRVKMREYHRARTLVHHLRYALRYFLHDSNVPLDHLEHLVLRCLGDTDLDLQDTHTMIEELRDGDQVFAFTDGAYKLLDTPHPTEDRTWLEIATRIPEGDTIQDAAKYVASFARAAPHSTDDITVVAMGVAFPKKEDDADTSAHERKTWMPE